jgi:hypothetical protein
MTSSPRMVGLARKRSVRRRARAVVSCDAVLRHLGIVLLCATAIATTTAAREARSDPDSAFVIGYATAVLEQGHSLGGFSVRFEGGTLAVDFQEVPETPLDTLERALLQIEGVDAVELSVVGEVVGEAGSRGRLAGYDVLSAEEMFDPLMADPRWPRFSATYQRHLDDDEITHVGSANFGESFAFVRSPKFDWGQWEIGIQAGVFSVFDLQSESNDLVNSDFLVGLTASYHYGDFTTIMRLYHQSSHLGDEFLLRNRVDRVNLSFEVLDLLVSFGPWPWLRLYGGGGLLVHRDPALDRGLLQSGIELQSPRAFLKGYVRPVAATDLQFRQESDWEIDASVRAGLQIEHPFLRRTKLRILAEFYSGRSPNGQFYERRIKTVGIGLHLNF